MLHFKFETAAVLERNPCPFLRTGTFETVVWRVDNSFDFSYGASVQRHKIAESRQKRMPGSSRSKWRHLYRFEQDLL